MDPSSNASSKEWPNPPTPEMVERVESARQLHRDSLIKLANLTAAQQERFDAVVASMNQKIKEVFDRTVARKIRDGEPLSDEESHAFLAGMSAAVQAADEEIAKLGSQSGSAVAETVFSSATQMDPDNALRVGTFHRRYRGGSNAAASPPPGTEPPQ